MTDRERSRRNVLKTSAVVVTAGIAGCGGDETQTSTPSPTPTQAQDVTFTVEDQTAEDHILVTDVNIDKPGWVIVWPEAEDGGPEFAESSTESPIAQGYVDAGSEDEVRAEPGDFVAPLREQVEDEATWYVVMHYDDPRNQRFTYPDGDDPIEIDGEMVMQTFTARSPDGGDGESTETPADEN